MSYIFMDESGDLGFDFKKKGTTSYFLITFLFTKDKRSVEKCVKKVHLGLRKKYKKVGVLHAQLMENHNIDIAISVKTPHEEKALQAVDFVSWPIFRKYESKDNTYYNIIRNIVIEENPLFP